LNGLPTAIDLGHNLGLTVTAEGVEDEETRKLLVQLGCDVAQGYFFSKPAPVDDVTSWLRGSPWSCIRD
jgi:EAL domain-containing protein (putative c-di-GMP-specific phosphodiesterase class I)